MKNYLTKILITGGNGQLGTALRYHPNTEKFAVTSCTRDDMNITNLAAITNAISRYSPDIVINTAAYTAVDKAEQNTELCMQINHQGAQNIALACRKHQIPLIHISTDYIFDGTKTNPYLEDDTPNPVNIYGKSKWLGEQSVREHCEQYIIVRVSGLFSEYGHNFMKTIIRLAQERNELRVVADQFTCPTYAGHLAGVIYSMISSLTTTPSRWGTYHYCDTGPTSWHAFAEAIITEATQHQKLRIESIKAITTAEYPTPAKRPVYSVLDCNKIEKNFGIRQAEWLSAIKQITGAK